MCAHFPLHRLQLLPSSVRLCSNQHNKRTHQPAAMSSMLMLIAAVCCSNYDPGATHLSAGNQLALCTLYLPRLPLLQLPVPALYIACGTTGHNGISCSCTLSCPAKLYLVGSGWLCFRSLRVMM